MVARNDITGDAIQSRASSKAFNDNYDLIFRKDKVTPKVEDMKKGTCGCGRSPTGDCIGWHGLNEQQLNDARAKWQADQDQKELDEYQSHAQELWNDSCTSGRSE